MERNHILEEFWSLRKLLNKGNKLPNEKTELSFGIERLAGSEYRLVVSAVGSGEENKIEIARRDRRGDWERSGYTNLSKFENYCSKILNDLQEEKSRFKYRGKDLQEKDILNLSDELQKRFSNLLVG